ncbi:right-handed parallel beta-helix repeat-containing protein, partial [Kordiimonas sp.]|uniref:right-handed parallel beta-helix repeat-containing protein n=1 Tax=Kordiimonas sp. TaxID=1970157 RepID=UPI003A8FA1BB
MATIISVSNAEELMNALASATGGDTIELAGGDYGRLTLINGKTGFDVTFDTAVTIRSVDADHLASFSGMNLNGVSNLTFDDVVFDYNFSQDDPVSIRPFSINGGSNNISIKNSIFEGDVASDVLDSNVDGFGYGTGLSVRDSSNISIENNEFFNWHRGAIFAQVEGLLVAENDVSAIRSDGFDFIEVKSVLIEKNHIHDFSAPEGSSDHRDMIQFWTSGTDSPSVDVIIRDNILDIGTGAWAQSIFMRNEEVDLGRAGTEMYYQNILIENNTIYNGHLHGITVGETDGLTIRNNSVLQALGGLNDLSGGVSIPKINLKPGSTSVVIEGNVTSAISGFAAQSDWVVSSNAIIQPINYLEHFITSTTHSDGRGHNFIVIPGSVIAQLGAGSEHIQFPYTIETLTPQFQVYSDVSSGQSLVFDASLTVWSQGQVSETDANFTWHFGDGSTATGQIVKHNFSAPGYHDVALTVTTKDGTTAIENFRAAIAGEDILQFDTQSGLFEALAFGEETPLANGALPLVETTDGHALKLGGDGTQASIAASELSRFFGTDAFELSMSLKADSAISWGEIARIHTSFTVGVDKNGNLTLTLFLEDGSQFKTVSKGVSLNDGAQHDVSIRFDGEIGSVEIVIDGKIATSGNVSGSLWGGPRPLNFGNPWGEQNFDGELTAFSLSAESNDFPIYDGAEDVIFDSSTPTPEANLTEADTATTTAPSIDTTDDLSVSDTSTSPETNSTEADTATTTAPSTDTTNDLGVSDTPTSSETDATISNVPQPNEVLPVEDSGAITPMLQGGYTLDFAAIATSDTIVLHDNAHVIDTQDGPALSFDGKRDFVELGRLTEFENSQEIAFSV